MNFKLTKPCPNCPFKRNTTMKLSPGRLEGIIEDLKNDNNVFYCHKTVHSKLGGEWDEESYQYHASGEESVCMGALAYMYRAGYFPIAARLAVMNESLRIAHVKSAAALIIDPLPEK